MGKNFFAPLPIDPTTSPILLSNFSDSPLSPVLSGNKILEIYWIFKHFEDFKWRLLEPVIKRDFLKRTLKKYDSNAWRLNRLDSLDCLHLTSYKTDFLKVFPLKNTFLMRWTYFVCHNKIIFKTWLMRKVCHKYRNLLVFDLFYKNNIIRT